MTIAEWYELVTNCYTVSSNSNQSVRTINFRTSHFLCGSKMLQMSKWFTNLSEDQDDGFNLSRFSQKNKIIFVFFWKHIYLFFEKIFMFFRKTCSWLRYLRVRTPGGPGSTRRLEIQSGCLCRKNTDLLVSGGVGHPDAFGPGFDGFWRSKHPKIRLHFVIKPEMERSGLNRMMEEFRHRNDEIIGMFNQLNRNLKTF